MEYRCESSAAWQVSLPNKVSADQSSASSLAGAQALVRPAGRHQRELRACLALSDALDVGDHEALPLGCFGAGHDVGPMLDGRQRVDDEAQLAALVEVACVGLGQGLVQLALLGAGELLQRRAGELGDRQGRADVFGPGCFEL